MAKLINAQLTNPHIPLMTVNLYHADSMRISLVAADMQGAA